MIASSSPDRTGVLFPGLRSGNKSRAGAVGAWPEERLPDVEHVARCEGAAAGHGGEPREAVPEYGGQDAALCGDPDGSGAVGSGRRLFDAWHAGAAVAV